MKKHKKTFIIVIYTIQAIVIFYLGYSARKVEENLIKKNCTKIEDAQIDEREEDNMKNAIYVTGMLATYQYIDREVNLEYFYKLNNMCTCEQIIEEIGEPNGQYGSGFTYKYYEIGNDLYVSILFSDNDRVALMRLCTQKEILDIIYPQ